MLNLLNGVVSVFKQVKTWSSGATIFWLVYIQIAILVVAATIVVYLLQRRRANKTAQTVAAEPATMAVEESIVVERLVERPVIVERPVVVEQVVEQPVVVERPVIIERIIEKPVIVEQVVERVIEKPVYIETASQTIVDQPPVTPTIVETVVIDEESVEAGRLRYDKSFTARVIQSDDEVKHWYTEVKNELLSYKTCKGRISWKRETFKANKQVVAMLVYRGKTLCLFLPLNPKDFDEQYRLEDASDIPAYEEIPALLRLKNDKRIRIAKELIAKVMEQDQVVRKSNYVTEDFYLPYEGVLELINKGLIKREIRSANDEAVFENGKQTDNE